MAGNPGFAAGSLAGSISDLMRSDALSNEILRSRMRRAQVQLEQYSDYTWMGSVLPERTELEERLERLIGVSTVTLSDHTPERPAEGPSAEYREKLKAIGAMALLSKIDGDAEIARFQDAVKERGLRFYNKENVERYLLSEARKGTGAGSHRVDWTPLAQYTQAIPLPVIDTMQWVKEEFSVAEFSISEVNRYPDPFLMVTLHGQSFIIEKWDEPSYREA